MINHTQSRQKYLDSDEAAQFRLDLLEIVADPGFNTGSTGSTAEVTESSIFVQKHMSYRSNNLNVTTEQYLSNLRLRTRIRK